jgi:hypothetical protein
MDGREHPECGDHGGGQPKLRREAAALGPPSAALPKGAPRARVTWKKRTMRKPLAVTPATRRVDHERRPGPLVINGDVPEGKALSCTLPRVLLDGLAR